MKAFLILLLTFLSVEIIVAQELRADVRVSTPQLQSTDPAIFEDLENRLSEFLNNQSFTDEYYEDYEKVRCNFQLTITEEQGGDIFKGELTIQSSRPVYGSDYETTVVNYLDQDVKFEFSPGTVFQFLPDGYLNNLSSLFSYWTMIIIGADEDTFSKEAGTPYFQKAENIAASVPPSEAEKFTGWRPNDSSKNRNRYWLAENLLNPKCKDFREALYNYHRYGLDVMYETTSAGQTSILNAIKSVQKTRNAYPNNMIVQLFSVSKSDEIVDVMARAPRSTQREAASIMSALDPSRRSLYSKLQ